MEELSKSEHQQHAAYGTLFVISAPSGAGKTTLCKMLLGKVHSLKLSVSYTTRQPRRSEKNDVDYTFISRDSFMAMSKNGEFAEWATVHGNLYGTSIQRLKTMNSEGYDVLLDIDVRGAHQIRKTYDNAVYIFVLPPSSEVLTERLTNRKTDAPSVIKERLDNAKEEIAYYKDYDYTIVNDDLDEAYRQLESIITSNRLKTSCIDVNWINNTFNIQ